MPVLEKECFWRKKQLWKKALKILETKKKGLEVEREIGVIMFKLGRIIKLKTHRWWLFACQQAGVDVTWIAQKLMQKIACLWLGRVSAMYIFPTYSRRALSTS